VNDGFVFLGHRIIRKRGPRGRMRPVTTIHGRSTEALHISSCRNCRAITAQTRLTWLRA
jgi:hypothetical protein